MARGSCNFKQRDVRAAVKAVRDAGANVSGVEVRPDGAIRITTSDLNKPLGDELVTELDQWIKGHAHPTSRR